MGRLRLLLLLCFITSVAAKLSHKVACETTQGTFVIAVHKDWSPLGVERFIDLVSDKFFDHQLLYRVIPGFLVQFGVAANPKVQKKWDNLRIVDEPKKVGFKHGTVSFAGAGPDS